MVGPTSVIWTWRDVATYWVATDWPVGGKKISEIVSLFGAFRTSNKSFRHCWRSPRICTMRRTRSNKKTNRVTKNQSKIQPSFPLTLAAASTGSRSPWRAFCPRPAMRTSSTRSYASSLTICSRKPLKMGCKKTVWYRRRPPTTSTFTSSCRRSVRSRGCKEMKSNSPIRSSLRWLTHRPSRRAKLEGVSRPAWEDVGPSRQVIARWCLLGRVGTRSGVDTPNRRKNRSIRRRVRRSADSISRTFWSCRRRIAK